MGSRKRNSIRSLPSSQVSSPTRTAISSPKPTTSSTRTSPPCNYAFNLRKLYLLNTNYADLSFLFTILPGEKTNAHLGTEYLAALETDNQTPYFLNPHNGEVAHTLILGMTGSGKSYFCNFLRTCNFSSASSECSSRATSSATELTSKKNAAYGMQSSACMCSNRISARSQTLATSSAS